MAKHSPSIFLRERLVGADITLPLKVSYRRESKRQTHQGPSGMFHYPKDLNATCTNYIFVALNLLQVQISLGVKHLLPGLTPRIALPLHVSGDNKM